MSKLASVRYIVNDVDAAIEFYTKMPDGTVQTPGGWNRFEIEIEDLESAVEKLKKAGCRFRNDIVTGVGGKQILLQDPSGNLIELSSIFKNGNARMATANRLGKHTNT